MIHTTCIVFKLAVRSNKISWYSPFIGRMPLLKIKVIGHIVQYQNKCFVYAVMASPNEICPFSSKLHFRFEMLDILQKGLATGCI